MLGNRIENITCGYAARNDGEGIRVWGYNNNNNNRMERKMRDQNM